MTSANEDGSTNAETPEAQSRASQGDLSDLLQELRILLQGVQVLTGFLIVLPFNEGFSRVEGGERIVYVVTFLCALLSLALLSAPAAQHRMMTPLRDRPGFKRSSTRMILAGTALLSIALVLTTHFVIDTVVGLTVANVVSSIVGVVIAVMWWIIPFARRKTS